MFHLSITRVIICSGKYLNNLSVLRMSANTQYVNCFNGQLADLLMSTDQWISV